MKHPRINIIVAVASDGAIGREGDLLYHISADLKRFKTLTMGHPVIMGRRTFESLPNGALPGRRNIVISRQGKSLVFPDAETATSLDEAIAICAGCDEIFIIGGATIYELAIGIADRIYLTRFNRTDPQADVYFPVINPAIWTIAESSETFTDEKSGIRYTFETLERKKNDF